MVEREREQVRTEISERLHEASRSVFPGGVSHNVRYVDPYPISIDGAEGPLVRDADGNEYVDFWNNHAASILGHAPDSVVEAVVDQVRNGLHYGAVNEPALELGRRVKRFVPSAERVRFCASGTEATMYAVRLARAYTGRDRVLKVEGGWHGGNTDLAVSVYPPFDQPTTAGLPPGAAEHVHAFRLNDEQSLTDLLDEYRGDIAAIIVDPRKGGVPPTEEFLDVLTDAREDDGVLLIFDEVVTGFRVSPGSYQARVGVTPDLTALGKILGGGLPVGALCGRAELFEPARPDVAVPPDERVIAGGGTFSMNPTTAAAGLATLSVLEEEPVFEHTESLAARAREGLEEVFSGAGVGGQSLGLSSLVIPTFGLESEPASTGDVAAEGDAAALTAFHRRLLDHGFYFNPGSMGNVSYATTEEHVESLLAAAEEVLADMRAEGVV